MPELLIAGAGPAGLATALYARRAGFGVTVLDPRGEVIDKACGEGLMPGALRALQDLGVDPVGHPIIGITYVEGGWRVSSSFGAGPGRGVRRTELSGALHHAARAAGVQIVRGRAEAPVRTGRGVRVGELRADYLVAADGLHSPVRRALGLDRPSAQAARYGLRRHLRLAPWTSHVEVHWRPDAEAYVTPVAPDTVGVAVLSGGGRGLDELLAGFPELAARVQGAEALDTVRGAGPLRQRARRVVEGPVLLVGDAAGYVDALTGEGIAVSLAAARTLVDCLAQGRPQAYDRAWRRVTRRPRTLTAGLLWARSSPLRPLIVPTACRAPKVFAAAVDQLAG